MIGCWGQLEKLNFPCAAMHGGTYTAYPIDGGTCFLDFFFLLFFFCNRFQSHEEKRILQRARSRCAGLRVAAMQTEITLCDSAHHQTKTYWLQPRYGNVQCPCAALPRGDYGRLLVRVDVSDKNLEEQWPKMLGKTKKHHVSQTMRLIWRCSFSIVIFTQHKVHKTRQLGI